jgi:hypothetical protein
VTITLHCLSETAAPSAGVLYPSAASCLVEYPLDTSAALHQPQYPFGFPLTAPCAPHLTCRGPLKAVGWALHLRNRPDQSYVNSLLAIITFGANLGYLYRPDQLIINDNLASALLQVYPDAITSDIDKRIALLQIRRIDTPPSKYVRFPLGLTPKSDGGWRHIHHLSYPAGHSVNNHTPRQWGSLVYTQFDEAVATVLRAGPHCLLVKRNLADAFRHIPVHPDDWWLLGFRWGEAFHQDLFLPFGLRTLPAIFDFFATALVWIARCKVQMQHIQHYLDNFLMVIPAGSDARPQPQGFLLREHLRGRWLPPEGLSLTRRLWKHDSPEKSTSKPSNWSMRHCAALLSLVMSWTHWSGFSRSCPAQSPPVVLFLRRLYDAQGTRNPQPRRLSSSATLGTRPSKQRSSLTSSGGKSSYLNGTAYASSSLHAFRPTCGRTPPAQKASAATSSSSPQSGTPAATRSSLLTHGASAAQEEAYQLQGPGDVRRPTGTPIVARLICRTPSPCLLRQRRYCGCPAKANNPGQRHLAAAKDCHDRGSP